MNGQIAPDGYTIYSRFRQEDLATFWFDLYLCPEVRHGNSTFQDVVFLTANAPCLVADAEIRGDVGDVCVLDLHVGNRTLGMLLAEAGYPARSSEIDVDIEDTDIVYSVTHNGTLWYTVTGNRIDEGPFTTGLADHPRGRFHTLNPDAQPIWYDWTHTYLETAITDPSFVATIDIYEGVLTATGPTHHAFIENTFEQDASLYFDAKTEME